MRGNIPAGTRLRATVVVLAALAITGPGCATAPLADAPAGPPPFRTLQRLVLVRGADRAEPARAKDPLDAVRESLEGEGRTTRTVEVGPKLARELRGVARLYSDVEARIDGAGLGGEPWGGRRVERVGGVAPLLDELQVDGAVIYYRFVARTLSPPALGSAFPQDPGLRLARPVAALALVDRDGNLLWFDWGAPERADRDPNAPSTAAEAVDSLLRVIHGDTDDVPGA